jgi:hypothetical protein
LIRSRRSLATSVSMVDVVEGLVGEEDFGVENQKGTEDGGGQVTLEQDCEVGVLFGMLQGDGGLVRRGNGLVGHNAPC